MTKKTFLAKAISVVSASLLLIGVGVSPGSAVDTTNLYFNLNASDPGSYNPSSPGTWTDLSSVARNGTIYGSPTYNSGTAALQFSGNTGMNSTNPLAAYVDMGAGFNDFTSGITVEFDAHFGSGVGPWERIFDFGNGAASDNLWVGSYASTNEIAVEVWKPNPATQTNMGRCRSADSVDALASNTFAKIVITLDGSNCHIYKNGVEVNTIVDGPAKAAAAGNSAYDSFYDDLAQLGSPYPSLPRDVQRANNYIGRSNWGTDAAFDGAIKYVRIYTAALNSTDVENNAATFSLTYSTTGSDSGSAPDVKTGNGLITLSSNTGSLTKSGHTFVGWATAANQTTGLTGSYNLSGDVTLYPAFAPLTYNVTYDEHGGSSVSDGSFTHGGNLIFPTAPTKAGYSFLGWFSAGTGGSSLPAATVAAGNSSVTLHAQWSPNTIQVSYEEHGGTAVPNGSYVFGNTVSFPTPPTQSGYAFAGWFTSASGGSALSAADVSANTSDVTLHAQWVSLPSQAVTWSPSNIRFLVSLVQVTPSSLATTSGDGQIAYSVVSAGTSGCSVNSTTGVISVTNIGVCRIRASASETVNYLADSQEVDFTVTSSDPTLAISLDGTVGSPAENSNIWYSAAGLRNGSTWSLTLFSEPQTLATGTFTNDPLADSAVLPAGLVAGWHRIVFSGVGASGESITKTIWFEVSDSGNLVRTSNSDPTEQPAELANTGLDPMLLLTGLTFVFAGSVLLLRRRRAL